MREIRSASGGQFVAQRFNLAGGARVLYLAEDQVTCLHEIQAFGWPPAATVIVPVQFDFKAVVDLRDPKVQALLHTSSGELAMNFRSSAPAATQELGERCAASGRIDASYSIPRRYPANRISRSSRRR
jgi:RES domain-containing protein